MNRPGPGVSAVMTTVGIIGSGMIGGTVARLSVAAGHHVVVSNSRGPETLTELVAELGPLATAGTAEQAAEAGDLVVVSIPVKAFAEVPAKPLAGKAVLDTGNYYPAARRADRGAGHRRDHQQRAAPARPARRPRREGVQQHLLQAPALAGPSARRRRPLAPCPSRATTSRPRPR